MNKKLNILALSFNIYLIIMSLIIFFNSKIFIVSLIALCLALYEFFVFYICIFKYQKKSDYNLYKKISLFSILNPIYIYLRIYSYC